MVEEKLRYYTRNVRYSIGVRYFPGDKDGIVLNANVPTIGIPENKVRDFIVANQIAIKNGLLKEVEEQPLVWDSENALDDEQVKNLLKSYAKLKSTLQTIDALPILYKIREAATEKGSNKQTMSVIANRIAELEPDEDVISREDMQGVS